MKPAKPERVDHREAVTAALIEALEKGTAPWQKPWDSEVARAELPINGVTGKPYKGGNSVGLMLVAGAKGYDDPRWMTYKQADAEGWQVRKGEKCAHVEFWQFDKEEKRKDPATGKMVTVTTKLEHPIQRVYAVFNGEQIDGIPPLERKQIPEWEAHEAAEKALKNSKALITHDGGDRAYYVPSQDRIALPAREAFPSAGAYYGTALHELGHWTGHRTRLDRDLTGPFGSESYAREELRAEMASMIIQSELGVPHDPGNHASYVGHWIKALKEDKNELFRAAKDAGAAADYVIGLSRAKDLEVESAGPELGEVVPTNALESAINTALSKGESSPVEIGSGAVSSPAVPSIEPVQSAINNAHSQRKSAMTTNVELDAFENLREHSNVEKEDQQSSLKGLAEAAMNREGYLEAMTTMAPEFVEQELKPIMQQLEAEETSRLNDLAGEAQSWTPMQASARALDDVAEYQKHPSKQLLAGMAVAAETNIEYKAALTSTPAVQQEVEAQQDKNLMQLAAERVHERYGDLPAKLGTDPKAVDMGQAALHEEMAGMVMEVAMKPEDAARFMARSPMVGRESEVSSLTMDLMDAVGIDGVDLDKEARKDMDAKAMSADRHMAELVAEQVQQAKSWTPDQAADQAAKDIQNHALEFDPAAKDLVVADMIVNAEASPAYRSALAEAAPELTGRIDAAIEQGQQRTPAEEVTPYFQNPTYAVASKFDESRAENAALVDLKKYDQGENNIEDITLKSMASYEYAGIVAQSGSDLLNETVAKQSSDLRRNPAEPDWTAVNEVHAKDRAKDDLRQLAAVDQMEGNPMLDDGEEEKELRDKIAERQKNNPVYAKEMAELQQNGAELAAEKPAEIRQPEAAPQPAFAPQQVAPNLSPQEQAQKDLDTYLNASSSADREKAFNAIVDRSLDPEYEDEFKAQAMVNNLGDINNQEHIDDLKYMRATDPSKWDQKTAERKAGEDFNFYTEEHGAARGYATKDILKNAEQSPEYAAAMKELAVSNGEPELVSKLDAIEQGKGQGQDGKEKVVKSQADLDEMMDQARTSVEIRYGDLGAMLVGEEQAGMLKDAAVHREMTSMSASLPDKQQQDAFLAKSPMAGEEKAQELDSAMRELDYLDNLPTHVAMALDNAQDGKVVNLRELDSVAYINRHSGDLTLAAKDPATMEGILSHALGAEIAHGAVANNGAEVPFGQTKYLSQGGEPATETLKMVLKEAGADEKHLPKVDALGALIPAPSKEKSLADLKQFGGEEVPNSMTFTAKLDTNYKGAIVAEHEHHVLQQTAPKTFVAHEKQAFTAGVPQVGQNVGVNYKAGKASVIELANDKSKAMER